MGLGEEAERGGGFGDWEGEGGWVVVVVVGFGVERESGGVERVGWRRRRRRHESKRERRCREDGVRRG